MIVLVVLLWILLGIVALAVLILAMPVHYGVEGAVDEDGGAWWRVRVRWAFGVLSGTVSGDGYAIRVVGVRVYRRPLIVPRTAEEIERARAKREEKEARRAEKLARKAEKRDAAPPRAGKRGVRWFIREHRLLLRILLRYVRALHLSGRVEGVFGLDDPARMVHVHQLATLLHAKLPPGILAVELDWVEEIVALRARVGGWLVPLQLGVMTLWLWVNRRTWRALRAA